MSSNSFKKLCRICLTQSFQMLSLHTELLSSSKHCDDEDVTVKEALEYVMSVELPHNEEFPEVICPMCLSLLKVAYELKKQFTSSQIILVKKLGEATCLNIDSDPELEPVEEDYHSDHSYSISSKFNWSKTPYVKRIERLESTLIDESNENDCMEKMKRKKFKNKNVQKEPVDETVGYSSDSDQELANNRKANTLRNLVIENEKSSRSYCAEITKQKDSSVELIYKNTHFSLKDVVVEESPADKPDYSNFLKNLGKTISARFANKPTAVYHVECDKSEDIHPINGKSKSLLRECQSQDTSCFDLMESEEISPEDNQQRESENSNNENVMPVAGELVDKFIQENWENLQLDNNAEMVEGDNEAVFIDIENFVNNSSMELLNSTDIKLIKISENEHYITESKSNMHISIPSIKAMKRKVFINLPLNTNLLKIIKNTINSYLLLKANDSQLSEKVNLKKTIQYNYEQLIADEVTELDVFEDQEIPRVVTTDMGQRIIKYKCQLCSINFALKSQYKLHLRRTHTSEDKPLYMCNRCLLVYPTAVGASLHILVHLNIVIMIREDMEYPCGQCGKGFLNPRRLLYHIQIHHQGLTPNDQQSMIMLIPRERYQMNRTKTREEATLPDSQTNKKNTHKTDSKQKETYQCHICGLVLANKKRAQYHMVVHSGEQHVCNICGKQFQRAYSLTKHIQIHIGKRNHLCSLCGKTFHHRSSLQYHIRIHNNERKYACPHCDRRFFMSSNLSRHLRVHENLRPYACSFCPTSFFSNGERAVHEMRHTGYRPYKCKYCDKGFIKSNNLKVHILSHKGPFKCDVCSETFIEEKYVLWHKKMAHDINNHKGKSLLSRLESESFPEVVNS